MVPVKEGFSWQLQLPIIVSVNTHKARMHSFWGLMMGAHFVSACYAQSWYHMDLVALAPLNLSLSAIIAALATQLRFRVRG